MKQRIAIVAVALTASVCTGSCATTSVNVDPAYVDDAPFRGMSCSRLSEELRLAHLRVEMLSNSQDAAAQRDAQVAYWTLGLGIRGDGGANVGALATAKGVRDAIIRVHTAKDCAL